MSKEQEFFEYHIKKYNDIGDDRTTHYVKYEKNKLMVIQWAKLHWDYYVTELEGG